MDLRASAVHSVALAAACYVSYWLTTFVAVALSRCVATLLSFALCFVYLLIFPFEPVGMAVLIGLGTLFLMLIGRPEDAVTAGITTAVVMVVAAVTPRGAWQEPILRVVDTAIGIAVGLAAALVGTKHGTVRSS
jgi:uncharacterized membrane protein YccC